MNVLLTVMLAVQMISAVTMVGLILVQHGKGADMGPLLAVVVQAVCSVPAVAPISCRAPPPCWRPCFCQHLDAGLFGVGASCREFGQCA